MLPINNDIIFNTIDNGIIILDEELNILAWNRWLELKTQIKRDDIINKNICEQFPYINKDKLKRKIKSALVTANPSFYSVDPHKFLIKIQSNSIVDKVYKFMRQDITLVAYDLEKKYVCLYIYDNTKFYETSAKLEELNEELQELSNRDPLTHSYNRRYFSDVSQKMLNLASRANHSLSVIILDIDNFKTINDNYGHSVGDNVIITLARSLEEYVRTSDVISRFGGEEFVILLYNVSLNNGKKIAEKIRKNVENLKIETKQGDVEFTLSLGVAQYDKEQDYNNLEHTITRADKALYLAKSGGKNQVIVSE
jgi:diguanylate cyclase (GGDEF)-like protein